MSDDDELRVTLLADASALRMYALSKNGERSAAAEMIMAALEDSETAVGVGAVSLVAAVRGLDQDHHTELVKLLALPQLHLFPLDAHSAPRVMSLAAGYDIDPEVAHVLALTGDHDDADVLTYVAGPYRGLLPDDMIFDLGA
jgi:hypothetical protein